MEVGFYHLTRTPLSRALPMLLEKVVERGHRVVLMAGSPQRLDNLNEMLWTFDPSAWLPHGRRQDGYAASQPIYLTIDEENPNGADVLVLLDGVQPAFVGAFERVIDMFDGQDDAAVAAARERWKEHRQAERPLTYWQQKETGAWEKKQ